MIIIDLSESESDAPPQTEEQDEMMVDEPSEAQAGSSAVAAAQPKRWRIRTRTHSSDTTPRVGEAPRDPVTAQAGDTPQGSDREDGRDIPAWRGSEPMEAQKMERG